MKTLQSVKSIRFTRQLLTAKQQKHILYTVYSDIIMKMSIIPDILNE